MTAKTRGTALPETAIILSIVLLVLLGGMQLAVIGLTQATADGAAFVAAHTAAVDANTGTGSTTASSSFPTVGNNVSVTAGSSTTQAVVSLTAAGLLMPPGGPAQYAIYGGDVEPTFSGGNGNGTFTFGANATLPNYCPVNANGNGNNCNPNYSIYLAQSLDSNGNGIGGQFKQWTCHLNAYQAVPFPSSISPQGYVNPNTGKVGIVNSPFDWTQSSTPEGVIYAADSGKKNAGMNC